jgi:hypothetical protein
MPTRTLLAAAAAATGLAAVGPVAAADAKSIPMRGVVSGSPYGASNGQMAIPVLFSKVTATKAGLRSPVGVIIVKRAQKVKLPDGTTTIPVNLRTGDRFKGTGQVGSLQRRVFYPRVVFPQASVYFRSKELSLSELSTAVDSLRKSLAGLSDQTQKLGAFTLAAVGQLGTQLIALQRQLGDLVNAQAAIAGDVKALLGRVGDLELGLAKAVSDLNAVIGRLTTIEGNIGNTDIKKLRTDLDGLIATLTSYAKLTDLPDLSGYALKTDIPVLSGVDLTNYVKFSDLPDFNQFAKLVDLPDWAQFVKFSDLPDFGQFLTAADLLGYAKLTDLPDFTQFALVSQLPSLAGYAKLTDLAPYAKLTDLTGYAKLTDLTGYAKLTDIPAPPDLSGYALKSELNAAISNLQGQITTLNNALAGKADTTTVTNAVNNLQTQINALPTKQYVDDAVASVKTKVNELVSTQNTLCTNLKSLLPLLNCSSVTPLP